MIRILIVDDHAIVRRGLKQLLLEEYPFAEFGEAENAEELIKKTLQQEWEVVICDMSMPGRSGLDVLKQLKQSNPKLPVLIMSMYPEDQYAVRVLKAGASGYLTKDVVDQELIKAIETVISGRKYITQATAEKVFDSLHCDLNEFPHQLLSNREFDIFKLLASGKTNSEISRQLSLSTTTVSTYRTRILEKMGLRSNTELTRYALEQNLL